MLYNFQRTAWSGCIQRTARTEAVWGQVIWGEGGGTGVPGKETRRFEGGGRTEVQLPISEQLWRRTPQDPEARTRTEEVEVIDFSWKWGSSSHGFTSNCRQQRWGSPGVSRQKLETTFREHGSDYSEGSSMTWQLRFLPISWFENLLEIIPLLCKS